MADGQEKKKDECNSTQCWVKFPVNNLIMFKICIIQIYMANKNDELTPLNTRCWADVVEGLKCTFKGWVKEVVEEVIDDKMVSANLEDKRLNTDVKVSIS